MVLEPIYLKDIIKRGIFSWMNLEAEIREEKPDFDIKMTLENAIVLMVGQATLHAPDLQVDNDTIWFIDHYKVNITKTIRKVLSDITHGQPTSCLVKGCLDLTLAL